MGDNGNRAGEGPPAPTGATGQKGKTGARRRVKKPGKKLMLALVIKNAGIVTEVANDLGVSRSTVRAWRDKDPAVAKMFDDAIEANLDLAESKLVKGLKMGQAWAVCFYLKCKGKHRGWAEKMELGGTLEHELKAKKGMDLARQALASPGDAADAINRLLEVTGSQGADGTSPDGQDVTGWPGPIRH